MVLRLHRLHRENFVLVVPGAARCRLEVRVVLVVDLGSDLKSVLFGARLLLVLFGAEALLDGG